MKITEAIEKQEYIFPAYISLGWLPSYKSWRMYTRWETTKENRASTLSCWNLFVKFKFVTVIYDLSTVPIARVVGWENREDALKMLMIHLLQVGGRQVYMVPNPCFQLDTATSGGVILLRGTDLLGAISDEGYLEFEQPKLN